MLLCKIFIIQPIGVKMSKIIFPLIMLTVAGCVRMNFDNCILYPPDNKTIEEFEVGPLNRDTVDNS